MSAAIFHFDLGSPYAYLAAERIDRVVAREVTWQPVLLGGLFKATGRSSWARTPRRDEGLREIALRAAAYGLPPLRYPDGWPGDYLPAMRAAMVAQQAGRLKPYALAAFRRHFVDGDDIGRPEVVLEAAQSAGLDPTVVAARMATQEVKDALREATEAALARGVIGVPTVTVGERVFFGDDQLELAAAA